MLITLTGRIGCGKSEATKILSELGILIIDADEIAHELTKSGTEYFNKIIEKFGKDFLLPNGEIDRRKLSKLVFSNKEHKKWLENLLHPAIWERVSSPLSATPTSPLYKRGEFKIAVIPLLTKNSPPEFLQKVIVIDCDDDIQIERLKKRDNRSIEEINNILANQQSRKEYLALADYVIENNGSVEELEEKIKAFIKNSPLLTRL